MAISSPEALMLKDAFKDLQFVRQGRELIQPYYQLTLSEKV